MKSFLPTYRVIGSTGVQAATVFQSHTLVAAEDETWVTLTTLRANLCAAGGADHAQTGLWTGAHTQGVGAVGRTDLGCIERQRRAGKGGAEERMASPG